MKKNRLDAEVTARELILPGENVRAYIMAGEVLVDGQVEYKPGRIVTEKNRIEVKKKHPYVSKGALKIEKAFLDFTLDIKGRKFLDIGISTGGFTDYVLKNGAQAVTGIDVNIDQVDYNLKKDKRLTLIKGNARYLKKEDVGHEPDIITIDVSFISVTRILPALRVFPDAHIIALIKPQFEAKKSDVNRGGVIKEEEKRLQILDDIKRKIEELFFSVIDSTPAGVKGRKGNREHFFLLKYTPVARHLL
ncbi:MAG: TlyA family RNA methyltransferase [Candidatus Aminicenantes bacterium]|nr:TlyA family RNA methyltransferase [Candidatus Aminicenantes bacterium]